MTKEALYEKIKSLILKRCNASEEEQKRINTKLDKLYDLKNIMLQQEVEEEKRKRRNK